MRLNLFKDQRSRFDSLDVKLFFLFLYGIYLVKLKMTSTNTHTHTLRNIVECCIFLSLLFNLYMSVKLIPWDLGADFKMKAKMVASNYILKDSLNLRTEFFLRIYKSQN